MTQKKMLMTDDLSMIREITTCLKSLEKREEEVDLIINIFNTLSHDIINTSPSCAS